MKILGIDTATKFLSLCAYDGTKVYEYNLEVARLLSSLLAPTIKRVIAALGWEFAEIDYFACGLGPGSFTGTRVGVATIKGLAWPLKKPIIGISTLDILAQGVKTNAKNIIPIIDAKRNLIYSSAYENKNGHLRQIMPYRLLNIDEFSKMAKACSVILGDGLGVYKEKILKGIKGVTILDKEYWYPKGHDMITLALRRIAQKKINRVSDIKPIYLYPKECQIKST
jgi:tRNA threonylcarbamoyladenosine biosynthesis protein TsaB